MKNYKELARQARIKILTMIHKAQTSHVASNFSCVDIFTVLYANLKLGDEVVISKGWAAATIYYFLAKQGKISWEDLDKFPNKPYYGLAETSVPGVHVSGGSMGHGLPVAVGMALEKKRANEKGTIYCIMSDGELNEGTTWESAMLASHHKLDNLVVYVDRNKWQAMGKTEEVINVDPVKAFEGFDWYAHEIDGHNHEQLERTLVDFIKPRAMICNTIKGKGVQEFSDKLLYHYKNIDKETYETALKELGETGKSDVDTITSATQYFENVIKKVKKHGRST